MAKKSISQKRAERQQQENQALNRVFLVFLLGLAAECYQLIVYRNYVVGTVSAMLMWRNILKYGSIIGLVLLIAGGVWAVMSFKKGDRKRGSIATWLAGAGAFFAVSGWIMTTFYPAGVTVMCVIVPVLTVLGLVLFLYQRECFLTTLALCGSFLAVWVCGDGMNSAAWRVPIMIGAVLGLVILAALALLVRKAQQDEGKLMGLRVLPVDCAYNVVYIGLAVCFICVLAALIYAPAAYYIQWALGIAIFAEMVYFTTKMM